ncbi:hypothetical protein DFH06DRAFT_1131934 [Mycena polygramma]|nr:hypothetical protein DFH06DRAFT_1131934 [Mycena polygramma]
MLTRFGAGWKMNTCYSHLKEAFFPLDGGFRRYTLLSLRKTFKFWREAVQGILRGAIPREENGTRKRDAPTYGHEQTILHQRHPSPLTILPLIPPRIPLRLPASALSEALTSHRRDIQGQIGVKNVSRASHRAKQQGGATKSKAPWAAPTRRMSHARAPRLISLPREAEGSISIQQAKLRSRANDPIVHDHTKACAALPAAAPAKSVAQDLENPWPKSKLRPSNKCRIPRWLQASPNPGSSLRTEGRAWAPSRRNGVGAIGCSVRTVAGSRSLQDSRRLWGEQCDGEDGGERQEEPEAGVEISLTMKRPQLRSTEHQDCRCEEPPRLGIGTVSVWYGDTYTAHRELRTYTDRTQFNRFNPISTHHRSQTASGGAINLVWKIPRSLLRLEVSETHGTDDGSARQSATFGFPPGLKWNLALVCPRLIPTVIQCFGCCSMASRKPETASRNEPRISLLFGPCTSSDNPCLKMRARSSSGLSLFSTLSASGPRQPPFPTGESQLISK